MGDDFFLDIHDSGAGSTIVFTHGWTDNRNAWDGVISNLEDQTRCIAWSIRGHGESFAPPPGQYTRCLLYTSPSPRDKRQSRMPSSA